MCIQRHNEVIIMYYNTLQPTLLIVLIIFFSLIICRPYDLKTLWLVHCVELAPAGGATLPTAWESLHLYTNIDLAY